MSIQVPSPSYGSVAGGDAGPSEPDTAHPGAPAPVEEPRAGPLAGSSHRVVDRSDDPGCPRADRTSSGEPVHAASPTRQSSAHARATIDLMHPPPAAPVPENRERPDPPQGSVRSGTGLNRSGSVRIAGGWGSRQLGWALVGGPWERTDDGKRRHRGGPAARTLLGGAARGRAAARDGDRRRALRRPPPRPRTRRSSGARAPAPRRARGARAARGRRARRG